MKVIITGANGFIGSHAVSFFANLDFDVFALVRNMDIENQIEGVSYLSYNTFFNLDSLNNLNGGIFIHLAGAAHKHYTNEEAFSSNITLTKMLLEKANILGANRFIFLSTAGLYREQFGKIDLKTPVSSLNTNTNRTKLEAEILVEECAIKFGFNYIILRTPLVYGKGVKANFLYLMKLVNKSYPLPFRAINKNKRSLVSIYNLLDLIKVCIEHPAARNETFLVSDDSDISTAEMVALMAKVQCKANICLPVPTWIFNLAGKILNKEAVVNRLTGSLQLDIEHTKKTLGWKPPYTVEHGFKLAVKK